MPSWLIYVVIGGVSGVAAGFFGVGGGIVVVPALIYWAGFSQHRANGTSLAMLLPPIGLAAMLEYYRRGDVDLPAAGLLAASMFVGAWGGSIIAGHVKEPYLRLSFGIFVCVLGAYLVYGACKRLGWI